MKKRFKILSIILCLILAFTTVMSGCDEEENVTETKKLFEGVHGGKAEVTSDWILKDGETDYFILVARDPDSRIIKAYQTLITFFNEATKITLAVKYDDEVTWTEDVKAISLGYNSVTESKQLKNANEEYTTNSYQIKTIGKTIFVLGTKLGVVYGAQDLLKRWFNYEVFGEYSYSLESKTDVALCNYDLTEVPDIPHMTDNILSLLRTTSDSYYQTGLRLDGYSHAGWGHTVHNTEYYLPYDKTLIKVYGEFAPEVENGYPNGYGNVGVDENGLPDPDGHPAHRNWYSDKIGANYPGVPNQLCFSAQEEFRDIALEKIKYLVVSKPEDDQFSFNFEDNANLCTCDACKQAKEVYGSSSGLYFKMVSWLAKSINEWMATPEAEEFAARFGFELVQRPIYVVGMCYHDAYVAPAVYDEAKGKYVVSSPDLVIDEHVIAYYCTRQADRFSSCNSNPNSSYRDNMNAWADISSHLAYWKYNQAWYGEQMQFNGYFSVIQQDYQFAAKNKVYLIMDEGQNGRSTFQIFRAYLACNMAWDCNQDFEELYNRFFDNYFGPASESIRTAFDALDANLNRQYYEGSISGSEYNLMTNKIYSMGFLRTIMALFDQGLKDIEKLKETNYELWSKYEKRISAESLCPRYLYLEIFYKSINADELLSMRLKFKDDVMRLGITTVGRRFSGKTQNPNDLWAGWGI